MDFKVCLEVLELLARRELLEILDCPDNRVSPVQEAHLVVTEILAQLVFKATSVREVIKAVMVNLAQ